MQPYRVLEITTTTGCTVGCAYCPQDKFADRQRLVSQEARMSVETFAACLRTVPADVDVGFSGYSEPWLNRDCTKMVRHAADEGHGIRVFTTLVGMRLSDVLELAAVGPKLLVVHLFDDGAHMAESFVTERYVEILRAIAQHDWPCLKFLLFGTIHPRLASVVPPELVVRTRPLISRGGSVDPSIVPAQALRHGAVHCTEERLFRNVLLPNGDLTLCCMDFERRHVIGNLLRDSYADLHRGEAFSEIVRRMGGAPGFLLCRHCEYAERRDPALAASSNAHERQAHG